MRTRVLGGLVAVGLAAVLLASCSDDDSDDDDAAPGTSLTTTSTAPSTSTTDGTELPDAFVPVDHKEDGGTDGDVLLDGRHFGWITTLVAGHNEIVGDFDLAEVFYGAEADQAAAEDTPDATETGRDFYIRNENPKVRAITVDPDGYVYALDPEAAVPDVPKLKTPAQFVADRDAKGEELTPVEITIEDGVVTKIWEVYLP